jgi:elongation factor P
MVKLEYRRNIMAEKVNVNEFKNGTTFLHEGRPHIVLESTHSKSGRGQAKVKTKVKDLEFGTNLYITFTGGTMVDRAFVERRKMQYLYEDGKVANFMDSETFEQIEIPLENVKEELKFLIEGSEVFIMMFEGKDLGISLDKNVTLEVAEAPDAVAGNTVTNATKKIKLETGIEIDAPQFIKVGDKVVVSTSEGKYVSKG